MTEELIKVETYLDKNQYLDMISNTYKYSSRQLELLSKDYDNISLDQKLNWNYNDWIKFEGKYYGIKPSDEIELISEFRMFSEKDKLVQNYTYNKFGICYHYLDTKLSKYLNEVLYHNIIINELTSNQINIYDLKKYIINDTLSVAYLHYFVSDDESTWFQAINREYAFEFCSKQAKNNSSYFCKVNYCINDKLYQSSVFFENL
jgi:hypothetical protein